MERFDLPCCERGWVYVFRHTRDCEGVVDASDEPFNAQYRGPWSWETQEDRGTVQHTLARIARRCACPIGQAGIPVQKDKQMSLTGTKKRRAAIL